MRPMSLRKAINDFCRQCIYDPHCGGGTWREQVAQCAAVKCPLWPFRPLPGSGPLAAAPTDPKSTDPGQWLKTGLGLVNSGQPTIEKQGAA